jgi:hypothetical protein
MNESAFYKFLRKECTDLKLCRVESAQRDGFPDILYLNKLTSFQAPLELKAMLTMPKSVKATGLRVEQNLWHYDWTVSGGTSYVLCWVETEQCALLWQGAELFPAWRKGSLGVHKVVPRIQLRNLVKYLR